MAVQVKGKSVKALCEERATILTNARKYLDEHEDDWTEDRQAAYDEMISDGSTLKAAIDRRLALQDIQQDADRRLDSAELPLDHPMRQPGDGAAATAATIQVRNLVQGKDGRYGYSRVPIGQRGEADYRRAFNKYLREGARGLSPEQHAALQSDDASQAGYLVASEQFATELLKDVDDLLFVRRYARTYQVREADTLGIRKRTAKASTFAWSSELAVSTEDSTLAFGKKVLTPHPATGLIKVSRDLLRRAVISPDQIVREELAIDAAELLEDGYLTGNGSQQPLGVFRASNDGISTARDVATGNTATEIRADGLINCKYALKSQYRQMTPRWLFHRDAVKMISKLKDGEGRYLWLPGLREGEPDMLLGLPIDESERAPNTFTTGLYVGILACWPYYYIADALDLEIQVLIELYATTNQVGYIGRLKTDGMPVMEEAFARVTLG